MNKEESYNPINSRNTLINQPLLVRQVK